MTRVRKQIQVLVPHKDSVYFLDLIKDLEYSSTTTTSQTYTIYFLDFDEDVPDIILMIQLKFEHWWV